MNDLHQPLRADIDVLILWSNVKLKGTPAPLVLPTRAAVSAHEYAHHDNIVLHLHTLNLHYDTVFTGSPWMCSVLAGFHLLQRLLRPPNGSAGRKFPGDN